MTTTETAPWGLPTPGALSSPTSAAPDLALTRTWLAAIEFAARDILGASSRSFLRGVYAKAAREWLAIEAVEKGFDVTRKETPREALRLYIDSGEHGGMLRSRDDIEMHEGPGAFAFLVHRCPYKPVCTQLALAGLWTSELTCPRLGCFAGAIEALCDATAAHALDEFQAHGACRGRIEVRLRTQPAGPLPSAADGSPLFGRPA